ncbi:hypothetical protein IFM89_031038 [Coptis chinensis]|uniref:Uncharacterized protein n=1 Tax=Coptis chinensis TaxID=261450 RepID=A0A835H711_9MAGN|nr:hypothetical protein IFM89_031038 [Coptis chinensis]
MHLLLLTFLSPRCCKKWSLQLVKREAAAEKTDIPQVFRVKNGEQPLFGAEKEGICCVENELFDVEWWRNSSGAKEFSLTERVSGTWGKPKVLVRSVGGVFHSSWWKTTLLWSSENSFPDWRWVKCNLQVALALAKARGKYVVQDESSLSWDKKVIHLKIQVKEVRVEARVINLEARGYVFPILVDIDLDAKMVEVTPTWPAEMNLGPGSAMFSDEGAVLEGDRNNMCVTHSPAVIYVAATSNLSRPSVFGDS